MTALAPLADVGQWVDTLTLDAARAILRQLTGTDDHACLIRTLGPIDRDRAVAFGVQLVVSCPDGSVDLVIRVPGAELARWHGFRYCAVGVYLPPGVDLLPDVPYWLIARDDGAGTITTVPIAQWAVAEHTAVAATAIWRPQSRTLSYGTSRTLGRPSTPREAKLAQRGQELIEIVGRRGRPIQTPYEARQLLGVAARRLTADRRRVTRRGLYDVLDGVSSVDGVAELLDRAGWSLADASRAANEFSKIGPPGE